jgi:hypothetical protein
LERAQQMWRDETRWDQNFWLRSLSVHESIWYHCSIRCTLQSTCDVVYLFRTRLQSEIYFSVTINVEVRGNWSFYWYCGNCWRLLSFRILNWD